jgi:hypothetical protein
MTICHFLRLSTVRILPRDANHAKKAALEGAWVLHILFQGKLLPSEQAKEVKKDLTLNKPFLEGTTRACLHDLYSPWLSATPGRRKQRHPFSNHAPL